MDHDNLFGLLRKGDRAALGRAITLIESERQSDAAAARSLVEQCLAHSGNSLRIGITGIPGVGKSTLIDALGMWMIQQGHRVAVLAIDPSSARSGGSILGDKTRMERLTASDGAFIRPTAAAGNLGGVARHTREAIMLCEAAGYDRILIETVGTGQNELEVDQLCDINVVLMIAGTGDELQGIKRGIMEAADIIAFTKAEGDARKRSETASRELRNAISLLPKRLSGRSPEIMLTSAVSGDGIEELGRRVESLREADGSSGYGAQRRTTQGMYWLEQALVHGLHDALKNDPRVAAAMPAMRAAVDDGTMSPFRAAEELMALFRTGDAPRP